MEKSHLKNSFIAAGIAVFAGVVALGANVAFGGNPTQDPTTAGLVSPTFSGLDVTGGIKNPGNTALDLTDPEGVKLGGPIFSDSNNTGRMPRVSDEHGFDVWGPIQNNKSTGLSTSPVKYPVEFKDAEGVKIALGVLDIWDSIKNLKPDTGSGATLVQYAVKIVDILEVTDVIRNPNTTGLTAVKIDDELEITGPISNPTGDPVKINDNADIYGDVNILQTVVCSDEGTASGCDAAGPTSVTKHHLTVSGDVTTKGNLKVGDSLQIIGANGAISNPSTDNEKGTYVRIDDELVVGNEYNKKLDYNKKKSVVYGDLNLEDYYLCDGTTVDCPSKALQKSNLTLGGKIYANGGVEAKGATLNGAMFLKNNPLMLSDDSWIQQLLSGALSIKAHAGSDLELKSGGVYTTNNSGYGAYLVLKNPTTYTSGASTTALIKPKVEIGASGYDTDLKVYGKITATGGYDTDLKVNGKATATGGFGTYKRVQSGFVKIMKNNWNEASSACPGTTKIVSCGGQSSRNLPTYTSNADGSISGSASGVGKNVDVSFGNLDTLSDKCWVVGINKTIINDNTATTTINESDRYVSAIATCHDSAN